MVRNPRHGTTVTVVGWLFIAYGVLVIVDVIGSAVNHFYKIDLGLLSLPIGLGVLRRRPGSRRVAICAAWLSGVVALSLSIFLPLIRGPVQLRVFWKDVGHTRAWIAPFVLGPWCLVCLWIAYALTRPAARAEFETGAPKQGDDIVPA